MTAYVVYFFGVKSHCWEIVRADAACYAVWDVAARYGLAFNIRARLATDEDLESFSRRSAR